MCLDIHSIHRNPLCSGTESVKTGLWAGADKVIRGSLQAQLCFLRQAPRS